MNYIYVSIFGVLVIAIPAMIIYAVVLYWRGKKMGVDMGYTKDEQERLASEDYIMDPQYAGLPTHIFNNDPWQSDI